MKERMFIAYRVIGQPVNDVSFIDIDSKDIPHFKLKKYYLGIYNTIERIEAWSIMSIDSNGKRISKNELLFKKKYPFRYAWQMLELKWNIIKRNHKNKKFKKHYKKYKKNKESF